MQENQALIITQKDFQKLSALLDRASPEASAMLEQELERAQVVLEAELPTDVVTMNSKVSFVDLDTGRESVVTLVFPQEAKIDENKVSILAPVGSALIGLRVGQTIDWPLPNGKERRLKVTSVLSQPETAPVEAAEQQSS